MSEKKKTPVPGAPARAGFYHAKLSDGSKVVAEWKEVSKKAGKAWFQYVGESPSAEKLPVLLEGVVGWEAVTRADVAKALKREPTVEEEIAEAYKQYRSMAELYPERELMPPESRKIKVGDQVSLGALKQCYAVALREEGRVIVCKHQMLVDRRNPERGTVTRYLASHWTGLVLFQEEPPASMVTDSLLYGAYVSGMVSSLLRRYLDGLEISPKYQRGYAWTVNDQQAYLDSVMSGRELGRFLFVRHEYPAPDELLDGKQRLTCLWLFFTSQIAYKGVYWHQLNPRDRDRIENRTVQYMDFPAARFKESQLLQVFLEVNAAGVPQSEEHLDYVRGLLAEAQEREAQDLVTKA